VATEKNPNRTNWHVNPYHSLKSSGSYPFGQPLPDFSINVDKT
jgi:hypothetical protein